MARLRALPSYHFPSREPWQFLVASKRSTTPGRVHGGGHMRRTLSVAVASLLSVGLFAGPALACGALISPNGTVQLGRTTTLAAYHNGVEHYVTEFSYQGGGAKFGSIVPLPAAPTKVIKAGRWTLQRLELDVNPPRFEALATVGSPASAADQGSAILR